jgi:Domain of unknown function (DUF222)/HNH endonuclease
MEAAEHGNAGAAETPPEATPDAGLCDLTLRELSEQITELAGHLNAANHRWLQLIAEFDRRNGWSDGATQSCAHWLSWKCGVNLDAAREKVRVSHALETLPEISAAMRRGELSYSKVRAITRVATPATEAVLLNVALHGTAHHVESLVQKFRRVQEVEELSREQRQHCNRGLTWFHDSDGSLIVKLQLSAENGALFLNAIQSALPEIPLPEDCKDALYVPAGTSTPASGRLIRETTTHSNRRADALVVVAESFLKHGALAMSGGERHQIVVHVDEATLNQRATGRCEHEDGPAMPVETARRLACDCSTVTITEDDQGEPLDVGRKTRSIPPSLRRALRSRDDGCVFPGCNHKRYVDGHHIQHWADGGATKLSNLVSLCRFHHRAVHEGGIKVERLDGGAWRFTNARGESLDACAPGRTRPLGDVDAMKAANTARGADVNASTAATRWRGERMHYGITIDSLLFRSREGEPSLTS